MSSCVVNHPSIHPSWVTIVSPLQWGGILNVKDSSRTNNIITEKSNFHAITDCHDHLCSLCCVCVISNVLFQDWFEWKCSLIFINIHESEWQLPRSVINKAQHILYRWHLIPCSNWTVEAVCSHQTSLLVQDHAQLYWPPFSLNIGSRLHNTKKKTLFLKE